VPTTAARPTALRILDFHLKNARARSDELFAMIQPGSLYERPIAERHRIVFYLGHLEAFDWNLICKGPFGMESFQKEFDRLFAFGIDPTSGSLPQDQPGDWPAEREILSYNARVRDAVDRCLDRTKEDQLFWVAIEHRLMHAETLAYMFHWLPTDMKIPQPGPIEKQTGPVRTARVDIPAGTATLGMRRDGLAFGWDNEFEAHEVAVPAFSIDKHKTTNAEYLEFVNAGGYHERSLWSVSAWDWLRAEGIEHPKFWKRQGNGWRSVTMFADFPFQPFWPVYVSHAEAEAYARWKGRSLPQEAQFHRAAYGVPNGPERRFPWGGEEPRLQHGNFDFYRWNPTRVDSHPDGESAFGVSGLVGNGWEWTCTPFAPFNGFKAFDFYPGYSADFFDGNHYVMKGGSSRTSALFLRRSFRNWFQPLYPKIYAAFRCVDN
jgi:iron(II)-dependent oxidoreductase